jgi:predicted secreted Zn-dependent protease
LGPPALYLQRWQPGYYPYPAYYGPRKKGNRALSLVLSIGLALVTFVLVGGLLAVALNQVDPSVAYPSSNPAAHTHDNATSAPTASGSISTASLPQIDSSFFGDNVVVTTYEVNGETPIAIERSIEANGATDTWTGGTMEAYTAPHLAQHWQDHYDSAGNCTVVATSNPAISVSFVVNLPRWSPDATTSATTVTWWSREIVGVATHEKHHVDDGDAAVAQANAVLATSTCDNAASNLETVYTAWAKTDCQFDLDEYGTALGETMATCMANRGSS